MATGTQAAQQDNFNFFLARNDHVIAGIRASEVADPYRIRHGLVPSIIVGPQLFAKNDKPAGWAKIIPPGPDDLPTFRGDRRGGNKVIGGSIVTVEEAGVTRNYLVSHRDERAYYVLVRTGLMRHNGSVVEDRLNLTKDGPLLTHGSYSFDKASMQIAMAENQAVLESATGDPKVKFGKIAAERLDTQAIGGRIPLLNCPQSAYVLWRVPIGAVLLVRDVNGKLTRLIAEKNSLRPADAKGYGPFYEQLEQSSFQLRLAASKEKAAAKIIAS